METNIDINKIRGFEKQQTEYSNQNNEIINELLESLGKKIKKIIIAKKLGISTYCIGFHIRNVLDIKSPRVKIFTHSKKSQAKADKINSLMLSRSYHTLNHVLDSLYYHKNGEENNKDSYLLLSLRTKRKSVNSNKSESEVHINNINWIDDKEYNGLELEALIDLTSILLGKDPNSIVKNINLLSDLVLLDKRKLSYKDKVLKNNDLNSLITNLYKFSSELLIKIGLNPSVFNANAIISSLLQLYAYSSFGNNNIILMYRPSNQWDYVYGVTLIYNSKSTPRKIATEINDTIGSEFKEKGNIDILSRLKMERYQSKSGALDQITFPQDIISKLRLLSLPENEEASKLDQTIRKFLSFSSLFCHEKYEGKNIKYGLILGNPKLLQYWSHKPLFSLTKEDELLEENDITKQVHLGENPAEIAIGIPFSHKGDDVKKYPAYILNLSNFLESLTTASEMGLWPNELKPYAFITKRYKWALAAVVGPYNTMRLFNDGELVAFRSGKYWYKLFDRHNIKDTNFKKYLNTLTKQEKNKLFAFISLVIFLSPIVDEDSHGGLLVYTPGQIEDLNELVRQKKIKELSFVEPIVEFESGKKEFWLSGKSIIQQKEKGKIQINYNTAQLIKRATKVDGAIVLYGPLYKVYGFRLNLKLDPYLITDNMNTEIKDTGTKDSAASSFVSGSMSKSVAVKISADGPVTLYYKIDSKSNSPKVFKFKIWEEVQ